MRLKRVEIIKFRNFENIVIDFEKNDFPDVFAIASKNGGGKSTLIQFIFILLHSFMDDKRKQYLQNLLEELANNENIEFVKFIIEHNNEEYYLNFSIDDTVSENINFNLYLDEKDTYKNLQEYEENSHKMKEIIELQHELHNHNRITPLIDRNLRYIKRYISNSQEESIYRQARGEENIGLLKDLIKKIITNNTISEETLDDLNKIYSNVKNNLKQLEIQLNEHDIYYITHLVENKKVLLVHSNMTNEQLKQLTNSVFLTAPISQIFLFLATEEKNSIFSEFAVNDDYRYYSIRSYYDNVKKAKSNLSGFFTYDFASTELILESFKRASQEDVKLKRQTGQYGQYYDKLTKELKGFLDGKEISENKDGTQVIFKIKDTNEELQPEDLSHGELKKLGIYIWLKYIVGKDAIVLMDEIDIALHPSWQSELVNNLTHWSNNSQFLLATHFPQIINSVHYKNIIKLDNGEIKRYSKPPIDRDINTIITQIMGAEDFPLELLQLHKEYRQLINDERVDTQEAKDLKAKILEYESENPSFFQDINFDLEL